MNGLDDSKIIYRNYKNTRKQWKYISLVSGFLLTLVMTLSTFNKDKTYHTDLHMHDSVVQ